MDILKRIESHAETTGQEAAFVSRGEVLTYEMLWKASGKLAMWIEKRCGENKKQIPVIGHKSLLMPIVFLACVRSGRGYIPVDTSMPEERINDILKSAGAETVFLLEDVSSLKNRNFITENMVKDALEREKESIESSRRTGEEDVFYTIFTSGSTGKPKGVEITCQALSNFVDWMVDFAEIDEETVILDQAPFSFDLSVMDFYTGLGAGAEVFSLTKKEQLEMSKTLAALQKSQATHWVSTPSFADLCLADRNFCSALLPNLKAFMFCGETLTKKTAEKLMERFPGVKILNTYGPTESTVAITGVEITKRHLACDRELPVGVCKPGTTVKIAEDTGEILIYGDTLSRGYFGDPVKTQEAFGNDEDGERFYRSGDLGVLLDGMLYCRGRKDSQVKFHGYRIELGDIESNLLKIPEVGMAAVVAKKNKEGKIRSLVGVVTLDDKVKKDTFESDRAWSSYFKDQLSKRLPGYMVPKQIRLVDEMPISGNGKIDRKRLEV